MRALTLRQPWAELLISGVKRIETRSWQTAYRGPLLIHAAMGMRPDERRVADLFGLDTLDQPLTFGAFVGEVTLVDIVSTDDPRWERWSDRDERLTGDLSPGRYAWLVDSPRRYPTPTPWRGRLGIWTAPRPVSRRIDGQAEDL